MRGAWRSWPDARLEALVQGDLGRLARRVQVVQQGLEQAAARADPEHVLAVLGLLGRLGQHLVELGLRRLEVDLEEAKLAAVVRPEDDVVRLVVEDAAGKAVGGSGADEVVELEPGGGRGSKRARAISTVGRG